MKKFFTDLLKDMIEQSWTLLGMAIAWLLLEGSARELTGNLILLTIAVWIITFRLRNPKDKGKE
jgi:hypothetical protein